MPSSSSSSNNNDDDDDDPNNNNKTTTTLTSANSPSRALPRPSSSARASGAALRRALAAFAGGGAGYRAPAPAAPPCGRCGSECSARSSSSRCPDHPLLPQVHACSGRSRPCPPSPPPPPQFSPPHPHRCRRPARSRSRPFRGEHPQRLSTAAHGISWTRRSLASGAAGAEIDFSWTARWRTWRTLRIPPALRKKINKLEEIVPTQDVINGRGGGRSEEGRAVVVSMCESKNNTIDRYEGSCRGYSRPRCLRPSTPACVKHRRVSRPGWKHGVFTGGGSQGRTPALVLAQKCSTGEGWGRVDTRIRHAQPVGRWNWDNPLSPRDASLCYYADSSAEILLTFEPTPPVREFLYLSGRSDSLCRRRRRPAPHVHLRRPPRWRGRSCHRQRSQELNVEAAVVRSCYRRCRRQRGTAAEPRRALPRSRRRRAALRMNRRRQRPAGPAPEVVELAAGRAARFSAARAAGSADRALSRRRPADKSRAAAAATTSCHRTRPPAAARRRPARRGVRVLEAQVREQAGQPNREAAAAETHQGARTSREAARCAGAEAAEAGAAGELGSCEGGEERRS